MRGFTFLKFLIAFVNFLVYFIVAFILNPHDPADSFNIGQRVTIPGSLRVPKS